MRLVPVLLLFIFLPGCQEEPEPQQPPPPPAKVSYSVEVRPWLIKNCLDCHDDLPLYNPRDWNLLHQHEDDTKLEPPGFVNLWVEQGSIVDPHWAGLPLREVEAASLDDLITSPGQLLTTKRVKAPPLFTASVADLLAGDLMEDEARTISTGYLRKGEDTPEWRIEKVAREFLGVRIECARCHDHPTEHWSKARHDEFKALFTTPFDHIPNALPPLFIKQNQKDEARIAELKSSIAEARTPAPIETKEFDLWKEFAGKAPQLPGLLAAYSFDDRQLTNLALSSPVIADGSQLVAEAGTHGLGVYFDGANKLTLSEVPISSELDPFTISAWIQAEEKALSDTTILSIGTRKRGFEIRIIEGKLQARWVKVWPQFAIAATSEEPLISPSRWAHLAVSYDGSRQADGLRIFVNGHAIAATQTGDGLFQRVLDGNEAWSFSGKGITLDEFQIYGSSLTQLGVRQLFDGTSLTNATQAELGKFFQRHYAGEVSPRKAKLRKQSEELLEIENQLPVYLVMSGAPGGRLEFARRLNPDLLARSLANEVWRQYFGSPLAHSLGFSDLPPENEDLLEWLASYLKNSNFDLIKLGEVITSSETWQREWTPLQHQTAECPRTSE